MVVLDMAPYDAIIGYDWLKQHSPMKFDWNQKTIEFSLNGKIVKLQGLLSPPLQATPILAKQVYNAARGNDTCAYVFLAPVQPPLTPPATEVAAPPPCIQ